MNSIFKEEYVVAVVFLHPFGRSPGSFVRVEELARSLGSYGVRSFVFSPFENIVLTNTSDGLRPFSMLGLISPLPIYYDIARRAYYSPIFKQLNIFAGLAGKFSTGFTKAVCRFLERNRLKVALVQAEQDFGVALGASLASSLKVPLVVDVHNITIEELAAEGIIRRNTGEFNKFVELEAQQLSLADRVIVVSPEMKKYVEDMLMVCSSDVACVPPGGRILERQKTMEERDSRVVYAGSLNKREHVGLYFEAARTLAYQRPDLKFLASFRKTRLFLRHPLRGEAVTPFWVSSRSEFFQFLGSSLVGAVPSRQDFARMMGPPVKLFDYASAGLPVVANYIGGWTDTIYEEGIGFLSQDTVDSFGKSICLLTTDSDAWKKCSENCVKMVKSKYNWDISGQKLLQSYKRVWAN